MTRRPRAPATLVVGLGNPDRGDDAVGLVVADRLAQQEVDAEVRAWQGSDLDLLDLWDGFARVVVIDAARTGDAPGTIVVATGDEVLASRGGGASHAFGLPETLRLAERLERLPGFVELRLVAVGDHAAHGAPLTPPVARAAARLVRDLTEELTPAVR